MATCVSYVNPEVLTPFFSNGHSTEYVLMTLYNK